MAGKKPKRRFGFFPRLGSVFYLAFRFFFGSVQFVFLGGLENVKNFHVITDANVVGRESNSEACLFLSTVASTEFDAFHAQRAIEKKATRRETTECGKILCDMTYKMKIMFVN